MRKLLYLAFLFFVFTACHNTDEKAGKKLQCAQEAFEKGHYNEAKIQIDSIKILYPKAFDARRKGIRLMQEIELKEQQKTLAYLDSLLTEKQTQFAVLKKDFVFEKDTAYQQIGNYLASSQTIEKNIHRSFLRFLVDENGKMSMTSIYCGNKNIHHYAIRVTAPDGSFAQTPPSKDSYETTDLGEKIEKADYKLGQDGNVISFLYLNKDKNIRINYIGDRSYSIKMEKADLQALGGVYELAKLLSSITEIKKNKEEANLKMKFVKREIEKTKQIEEAK